MQGIWRHSRADILELMDEGIAALAALLGDKQFLVGAQPCVADAAAFAFLDKCAPYQTAAFCVCDGLQVLFIQHASQQHVEPCWSCVSACSRRIRGCLPTRCCVSGLRSVLYDQVWADPALKEAIQQYSNLVKYTDRIRSTFFAAELAWEETS